MVYKHSSKNTTAVNTKTNRKRANSKEKQIADLDQVEIRSIDEANLDL